MKEFLEYITLENGNRKFKLPVSFLELVKLKIFNHLLFMMPFWERLYINSPRGLDLYWEIVLSYVEKYWNIRIHTSTDTLIDTGKLYVSTITKNSEAGSLLANVRGHGTDIVSMDNAISKSVGEFLERVSVASVTDYDTAIINLMTLEDIRKQAKLPLDFHDYGDEQKTVFPILNWKPANEFNTILVKDLINRSYHLYPTQYIFWKKDYNKLNGQPLLQALTTSGCAGGFSLESATLSAIYESIERDSFSVHWLSKTKMNKIQVDAGVVDEFDKLVSYFDKINVNISVFDSTTDVGIPSVVVLATCKISGEAWITSSCNISIKIAIKKAILEMMSFFVSGLLPEKPFQLPENYKPFITRGIGRAERLSFWKNKFSDQVLEQTLSSSKVIKLDELINTYPKVQTMSAKDELEYVLKIFKEKRNGYENVYRFVSNDIRLNKIGYFVVRVIIPKLYPLYLIEHFAFTKSDRVNEFVKWKTGSEEWELNTLPHPFP